jgi:uncharacterized protein (TIGR03435 family)
LTAAALLAASVAWSQPGAPHAFEVASVKVAVPGKFSGRPGVDRIDFHNVSLWYCASYAYGVRSYQLSGPGWLRDARFDIAAKGPDGTVRDQLPAMMQSLLAERLGVKIHRETREISALAIVVGKNGPKLTEAAATSGDGAGGANIGLSSPSPGVFRIDVKGGTMTSLANTLSGWLGRPVVDKTGLAGRYDFALDFSPADTGGRDATGGYNEPPPLPSVPGGEPALSVYSSIQQQLGLRLDAQKLPLEVVVIDHAEKTPIEN